MLSPSSFRFFFDEMLTMPRFIDFFLSFFSSSSSIYVGFEVVDEYEADNGSDYDDEPEEVDENPLMYVPLSSLYSLI